MQLRRSIAALALGAAAAIAACAASPDLGQGDPGSGRAGAGSARSGLAGPGSGGPGSASGAPRAVDGTASQNVDTWEDAMELLGAAFDQIKEELDGSPPGDLATVTRAATRGAALVRLGYGVHRDAKVDNFAQMARDCESWLLRIAAEAGQDHGILAQDLFRGGEARYCTRCHDACDVYNW